MNVKTVVRELRGEEQRRVGNDCQGWKNLDIRCSDRNCECGTSMTAGFSINVVTHTHILDTEDYRHKTLP